MQEEGIAAAAAGHLHDQLVVVVADRGQLRALGVAAAHPAAMVSSLGPQELQDGIFHRRPVQYRTGKPGSPGWATQFGMRGETNAGRRPTRAALCAMRAFETFGDEHRGPHPRPKCKPNPGDPGLMANRRRIIDGRIVAKPLILLTNDDGIYAQGILAAWQELRKIGEVEVVAPDAERSAVGHAITLLLPLRTKEVVRRNVRFGYGVNGLPGDCVKIAGQAH